MTQPSETAASATVEYADPLAAARLIAPRLHELGGRAEQERRLTPEAVALLGEHNLFNIFVPRALGGLELDLEDGCAVIEEISAADAATGWCLLKTSSTNAFATSFPPAVAREIWSDPSVAAAGSLNPKGRAVETDGGYRLTGRWDWGTASPFARWLMGGGLVFDEGSETPRVGPMGPEMRIFFFPAVDAELIDTWHTHGMRGTGSGDFAVTDVFVPERFAITMAPPATDYRLFDVPMVAWMMVPHAAVAIGIARAAIGALADLAAGKVPLMSATLLKDKGWVQDAFGRASAQVAASRAYVERAITDSWCGGPNGGVDPSAWPHLSLASTHATHECVAAVDAMYRAAGGSAVYSRSPIQQQFRDIHVAASHFLVNAEKYASVGRSLIEPPERTSP